MPAETPFERERTLVSLALNHFHRQSVVFKSVNGGDVGVERREHLRLTLEAGHVIRVAGESGRQNVQRHFAFELAVPRAIDLAHASRADRREDLVGSQTSAGSPRHMASNDSTLATCAEERIEQR